MVVAIIAIIVGKLIDYLKLIDHVCENIRLCLMITENDLSFKSDGNCLCCTRQYQGCKIKRFSREGANIWNDRQMDRLAGGLMEAV